MLNPTGFWSYSITDDENARGRLSQLRSLLASELQQRIGRNPKVNIFQDVAAIPPGTEWENQLGQGLHSSFFIIPIITPAYLQSEWCCRELAIFRERERQLGRNNLIFPLYYIDVQHVNPLDRRECYDKNMFDLIFSRQIVNIQDVRFKDPLSEEVALRLEKLARAIWQALRQDDTRTTQGVVVSFEEMMRESGRIMVRSSLASLPPSGTHDHRGVTIEFLTKFDAVEISADLRHSYPSSMAIILQHKYENLYVEDTCFSVEVAFRDKWQRIRIPFAAVIRFIDSSKNIDMQFTAIRTI